MSSSQNKLQRSDCLLNNSQYKSINTNGSPIAVINFGSLNTLKITDTQILMIAL